ncbi:S-layer homology domain-containing protein [Bengtsoniella intestinalis]|uniref:S-layer homology domain-containing protein n=1 Tax=Bengtsoniella intestinalis TaxID=3073143 RepID=UPI00391F3939
MKKFLSLALALVMTMSLVTISASADFTDDSDIAYSEAVEVMYALEVISGYTDGTFDPTATLTRGAAAKIICNLILGPTTAEALGADTAPFPDVSADHVFAGYIAYCAQQGIVGGYADGNFYPAGTVTGVQFMKMLLGALGYDSSIEGFTGDNWSINVQKLALSLGLDDGNDDYVGSDAMTREEACLYALNTLTATMVEYPNNTSLVVGDISITTSSSSSKMENNASSETIYSDDYMQFAENYFTNLKLSDAGENAFGQPVTTWKIKSTEVGTYINNDELVAEYEGKVTHATLYSLIDDDADVTVYVNGNDDEWAEGSDLFTKNSTSAAVGSGNGSVTYVYETDDEVYTIVTKNIYVVQAISDYDDDDEELKIDRLENDDLIDSYYIYNDDVDVEEFEEDDYILVTVADGVIKSAALAEVVSGSVSTYSSESSVTIDGTKYSYSKTASDDVKDESYTVGEDAAVVLDQQGNVIYVDDAIIASDRYVFIANYDANSILDSWTYTAGAYFSDGTYAAIEVDEIYDEDAENEWGKANGKANAWFTYSQNSDGTYDLTAVEDDYWVDDGENIVNLYFDASDNVISSGSVTFAATGYDINDSDFTIEDGTVSTTDVSTASIKGNSSTVFVIYDGDDVYMYTGVSNVADVTTSDDESAYVYALLDGNYAAFVFVDASNADVDGASNAAYDYMFVLYADSVTYDENGDLIYGYDVIIDGEESYVWSNNKLDAGVLYKDVDVDSNDYIDDFDAVTSAYKTSDTEYYKTTLDDAVFTRSSDVLTIKDNDDDEDYIIGDDAVVYIVVAEGVEELLYDNDADFELNEVYSAKSVVSFMEDYDINGYAFTVVDDDDGSTDVLAMYIYVTGTNYVDDEDDDVVDTANYADYEITVKTTGIIVDVYNGASNDDADVIDAIIAYLADRYSSSSYTGSNSTNDAYGFLINGASYYYYKEDATVMYAITFDTNAARKMVIDSVEADYAAENDSVEVYLTSDDGAGYNGDIWIVDKDGNEMAEVVLVGGSKTVTATITMPGYDVELSLTSTDPT